MEKNKLFTKPHFHKNTQIPLVDVQTHFNNLLKYSNIENNLLKLKFQLEVTNVYI